MGNYVLKRNEDGKYVSRPGSLKSYTSKLENARQFKSREEAEGDRCVESETIVPISALLEQ